MTSSESAFQLEPADHHSVVTFDPSLSKAQWSEIEAVGNQLVERLDESKEQALTVDLSNMDYIGSSTVALIVRLWKTVQKHEGRLAVVTSHPVVLEVLQIAGLNKIWTIVDTREQALSELGVSGRDSSGGWLIVAGLAVAVIAVVGLVVLWIPEVNAPRELLLGLLFGGAGLGLLLGLVNTVRQQGLRRAVSLTALLVCLAVGIVGGLKASGQLDEAADGRAQQQGTDGNSDPHQESRQ